MRWLRANGILIVLLISIISALCLEPHLSIANRQFFLAVSLVVKEIILFILPFVIFGLLFGSCRQFSQNATGTLLRILLLVCLSNLVTTALGCAIGSVAYGFHLPTMEPVVSESLTPLFSIKIPPLIGSGTALLLGMVAGIFFPKKWKKFSQQLGKMLDIFIGFSLKVILPLLPIFIFGFLIKLRHDGAMSLITRDYISIFALILLSKFSYIFFIYFWMGNFQWSRLCFYLKNMLPATFCGFSTMSSAATLPISLTSIERNVENKALARSVVPLTVNIHLIGNNFTIPILAFALLKSYGIAFPALSCVCLFLVFSIVTKFSVVAVPGGGIIVMLPILERYLGFDAVVCSTMFAIYLLLNPILTVSNVLGNGAFALLAERFISPKGPKKQLVKFREIS
ncbi:MAG: dicarboxylate/amino acid:cation symporter [Puniceicoccales bacterium]|jgi:Na+/H+-dicarboxylate symporter|nr:dicarboxylate/amino acid:cation symporter [Puniceicoccales bacterium]